jgi:cytochrome c peroxidase
MGSLPRQQRRCAQQQPAGAQTFLTLKCSICHTGATFSDENFAMSPWRVGQAGEQPDGLDDFGRFNVTGLASDVYRFRTTPLRNVELSGPYGHDGAITTLRAFVEHYSESDAKLFAYDVTQLEPRLQGTLLNTQTAILAQRDTLLKGVVLTDALVDQLMAYMSALTDDAARDLSKSVPKRSRWIAGGSSMTHAKPSLGEMRVKRLEREGSQVSNRESPV